MFPVPTATILGGPDLYVDKGSTINLTCAIRFSPEPPAYIFWFHKNDVSNLMSFSSSYYNNKNFLLSLNVFCIIYYTYMRENVHRNNCMTL